MFEQVFKEQLHSLTGDEFLIQQFFEEIRERYSEAHRHYHTLEHLNFMLSALLPVKNNIRDWKTIVLSLAYHDIVYRPAKNNNEEQSAKLAYSRLTQLSLDESRKQKCVSQILATKTHQESEEHDTNYLIDADLAILGTSKGTYKTYARQIRKEYRIYPDFVYNPGRKKVLQHFLQMHFIYKTNPFREKFEAQAKQNLKDELLELQ